MLEDTANKKLAVMIDADNAEATVCPELLAEIAKFGIASVKRAYGDWTTPNLKSWKDYLHKYAIQPMQQFRYTTGKNSTDSALIIDAMDLLHEKQLDGFCLVSSDSDFTRLATRIRESGLIVYGFGKEQTPKPFVAACDKFVFSEILKHDDAASQDAELKEKKLKATKDKKLKAILDDAVKAVSQDDDWAHLGGVFQYINKKHPSFDARHYGHAKPGKLIESLSYIETRKQGHSAIYIKIKNV